MSDRTCCQRWGRDCAWTTPADLCDPCARQPASGALLPVEFLTGARMRQALAGYDFATVLKSVRRATGNASR